MSGPRHPTLTIGLPLIVLLVLAPSGAGGHQGPGSCAERGPCYGKSTCDCVKSGGGKTGGGGSGSRPEPERREPEIPRRILEEIAAESVAREIAGRARTELAAGRYENAIRLYTDAMNAHYNSTARRVYGDLIAKARQGWFDSKLTEVADAVYAKRYDDIPQLLKAALQIQKDDKAVKALERWTKFLESRKSTSRALKNGDVDTAARLLDQTMDAFGVAAPGSGLETAYVLGADSVGDGGVRAFKAANDEFHRADKQPAPLFKGSPEAVQRAARLRAAANSVPDKIEGLTPTGGDKAFLAPLMETARAVAARVDEMIRRDSAAQTRLLAHELRQDVLRAGRFVMFNQGEDPAATVAFIREMQNKCVGSKDVYCPAWQARAWKDKGDSRTYQSRRDAEHYLFAKALAEDFRFGPITGTNPATAVLGGAAGIVLSPIYSAIKGVWPGSGFAGSPPSHAEVGWGQLGAVVGLTGYLDPTQRQ